MATDYLQVLTDLREEESRLEAELKTIRASIPALELMAKRNPQTSIPQAPIFEFANDVESKPYVQSGTKSAILHYLNKRGVPLMPSDIVKGLVDGGISSRSTDFPGMVGSTLTQMKWEELVERVEEGWQIKGKIMQPPVSTFS